MKNSLKTFIKLSFFGIFIKYGVYPQIDSQFDLIYQKTDFNEKIILNCENIKKRKFIPTFYLGNGTLQAYYGSFSQFKKFQIVYQSEEINLQDKGKFWIKWAKLKNNQNEQQKDKKGLIIIVPGITASSDEPYIINMVSAALKENYDVLLYVDRLYNIREQFSLPKNGYFCFYNDFSIVMKFIQEKYGNMYENVYAVGHSWGANTLVKYLGDFHNQQFIKAAVSVGNPFDLKLGSDMLSKNFEADQYILQSRKTILKDKIRHFTDDHILRFNIDFNKIFLTQNCQEFDNIFTRKLTGHNSLEYFFKTYSSQDIIDKINIPMLCLHSEDDPIIHHTTIPKQICEKNQNIILLITKVGGHVGWFEGFLQPQRWYMKTTMEYINYLNQLSKNEKQNQQLLL